ncbi:hypothetical protein NE865_15605 [Phthorimaea operculella]|nr:hypothetical protein NE865_15605 [Phthorimaea operculella]
MTLTSMGELAQRPPPSSNPFFKRIVELVGEHYSDDWETWIVNDLPYEELFGESIDPEVEKKLRFALPSMDLLRAWNPSAKQVTERVFRDIRRRLLDWPFGRTLIFAPQNIMAKIHDSSMSYNYFMDVVAKLKPSIISRKELSAALGEGSQRVTEENPTSRRSKTPSTPGSKRHREPSQHADDAQQDVEPEARPPSPERKSDGDELIKRLAKQQELMYKTMLDLSNRHNESIKKIQDQISDFKEEDNTPERGDQIPESLNHSFEDSSSSQDEDDDVHFWKPIDVAQRPRNLDPEACLREQIAEAQRKLSELQSRPKINIEFAPNVTESEAKITQADPVLAEQGSQSQRLGSNSWKNIRYKDVQRKFQATPVFTALKVNSQLALATPFWHSVSILEKIDSTLAAISHGLLQQRQTFVDACKNISPEIAMELNEKFLQDGCEFRKVSDALLQYTCGKRAEVIQQRRELYRAPNKVVNELLHDIPPSDTHLFSEAKLSEVLKDQGGVHKVFPPRFKKSFKRKGASSTPKKEKTSSKTREYKNPQEKPRFHKQREQKPQHNKSKPKDTKRY